MGAGGWSKLGEDVCSRLEIFILYFLLQVSKFLGRRSPTVIEQLAWAGFGDNPKLKSRDAPS